MNITKGDYIQGYEMYGNEIRQTKGWVRSVHNDGENIHFGIKADDEFHGARGTTLRTEYGRVIVLNENTGEEIRQQTGFTITCNNCGKENDFKVNGVTGHGVNLKCDCDNDQDIFW